MAEAKCDGTDSDSYSQRPRETMTHMFDKVIASDKVIKSQQRGEPDLTRQEKLDVLSRLVQKHPSSFLTRFGSLLDEQDLDYFSNVTDYEVQFQVTKLKHKLAMNSHKREAVVKNRRLEAIGILTANTDYFSEEAMRERNPLLYEYYIGQYLSEEERKKVSHCSLGEVSLATHFMKKLDEDRYARTLRHQQDIEEGQLEEGDEDSSEEEEETIETYPTSGSSMVGKNIVLSVDPLQREEEKSMLRKEFLTAMHMSFLKGEDSQFDYSSVDYSEDYDNIQIEAQDSEDAYFDSEEPSWSAHDPRSEENDGDMDTDY